MPTDEETWLANNPTHPEAVAIMAERADAERIRKAHEPKRFIIRKAAEGNIWAVRDQARPAWSRHHYSFSAMIEWLDDLHHNDKMPPEWDGVVRVVVRKPEPDPDYDEQADKYDWDE